MDFFFIFPFLCKLHGFASYISTESLRSKLAFFVNENAIQDKASRWGLHSGSHWGSLQCCPKTPSWSN